MSQRFGDDAPIQFDKGASPEPRRDHRAMCPNRRLRSGKPFSP